MKEHVFYEEFDSLYFYSGSSQNWGMHGFHFHKNYEIILFMCDNATINVENRMYTVEKGDLFLLNDREYHKTVGVKDAPYKRYVLMFNPEPFRKLCQVMEFDFLRFFEKRPENFIHKINLTGSNLADAIKLFDDIGRLHSTDGDPSTQALITMRIAELLTLVQDLFDFFTKNTQSGTYSDTSDITFAAATKGKDRISAIKQYIKDNIEEHLSLDEIAKEFFINRHYLSHYFKKETGFSVSEYITNQKIVAAKKLLKSGVSVTETAFALSFNSDSYFINVFKQMTGITPKKYIMEKKNTQNKTEEIK